MFDEIPRRKRSRASRTQVWLWIGLSILWLAIGSRDIERHRDLGWPTVVVWGLCLMIWIWRLVASYREDAQKDMN